MASSQMTYKEKLLLESFRPKPPDLLLKKELNRGAYGVVYRGVLGDRPVAVKKIHKLLFDAAISKEEIERTIRGFKKEADMLETMQHPHVVKSFGAFYDPKTREPILVMELMATDLRTFLQESKEQEALKVSKQVNICFQIALGLQYLHHLSPPLAHRDLNDKNVLLAEDGTAKIGDLGQSKYKNMKDIYFNSQTPGNLRYMPPEATSDNPHYTESVDIFSLGVLAVEVATQSEPSPSVHGIGVVPEVKRRANDLKKMGDDHPLKPLILKCLENNYKERPIIDHVVVKISEIFICEVNKDSELDRRDRAAADERHKKEKDTVSHLEARNHILTKDLDVAKKELDATKKDLETRIQHEVKITRELRTSNEEKSRLEKGLKGLQNKHEVLSQQYHDSQRTVEKLREEIREFKDKSQQLKPVHPAAKPVGTSSDSSNRSKAVSEVVEEDPLARIPFGRQKEERYLLANASTSGSCQSVVAFGMVGHGKSTFLNFILRQKHFKTSLTGFDVDSVTKTTESAHVMVEGRQLLLIDTPGFWDTHDIVDIGDINQDTHEIWEDDFRKNVRQAYLDAGQEVKAFILVYSLTCRWTVEVTLVMKFLDRLSFPWDRCIVVLTHGDHAFPGMPEEERYKALKEAMAKDKLPKQLKRIITESSDRILIIENTRAGDEEYHRSIVRRFLSLLDSIPGSYTNPHFLHFAQLFKTSRKEAYKAALRDKHSMRTLEGETRTVFERFISAGKEAVVPQTEFLRDIWKAFEGKGFSLRGIFGFNNTFYAGQAYHNAHRHVERLYHIYWEIMRIIQRDNVGHGFPEVHNLLFAHLAGVHMHGVKAIGDELCSAAENLAIYHRIRKQAEQQITSSEQFLNYSKFNSSEISPPNYAFPVGFNPLEGGSVDVAYSAGDKVHVTRVPVTSKEVDMLLLSTLCIVTLEKEMNTIKSLCNLPTRRM